MEYRKISWALGLAVVAILIGQTLSAPSSTSSTSSSALPSTLSLFKSLSEHDPRIINGTLALLNETKHQVSIRRRLNDGYFFGTGHICGGSLISENVVLCAAHCFVDQIAYNGTFSPDDEFIVVMGNLDRFENNNNTLVFDINIVVKYDSIFNVSTYDHDLVLVMLNGTVPADHPTIKPISLNGGSLKGGTVCQVTGWGVTEDGYSSDFLMTVDVPIITHDECRNETAYLSSIHDGMVCAGYLEGERDACQGDSGGPLVCQHLQAGIVSWGSGCAEPIKPGVYTDVSFYKEWILTKVAEYNGTLPKFVNITNNSTTGGDGGGGGSMSNFNGSIFLVALMVVFNVVLSKF